MVRTQNSAELLDHGLESGDKLVVFAQPFDDSGKYNKTHSNLHVKLPLRWLLEKIVMPSNARANETGQGKLSFKANTCSSELRFRDLSQHDDSLFVQQRNGSGKGSSCFTLQWLMYSQVNSRTDRASRIEQL